MPAIDQLTQRRTVGPELLLAHQFIEGAWSHSHGQWCRGMLIAQQGATGGSGRCREIEQAVHRASLGGAGGYIRVRSCQSSE